MKCPYFLWRMYLQKWRNTVRTNAFLPPKRIDIGVVVAGAAAAEDLNGWMTTTSHGNRWE